jgi:hypothetical protein
MNPLEDAHSPAASIARHRTSLAKLSDSNVLAVLQSVEPLPDADDDDPAWSDHRTFDRAYLLLALADEIGERRLVDGIAPLFARVALGDGYEMMPSVRHGPERAVAGDWATLTGIMVSLAKHDRAGTRRWALWELGLLRDPGTLELLSGVARQDPEPVVRAEAVMSLRMLADVIDPLVQQRARLTLQAVAEQDPSQDVRFHAAELLGDLDPVAAAPLRRPPRPLPFMDPTWHGDASGRAGAEATRRVIRALITGALAHPVLDAFARETGFQMVMTPGDGVYPPNEPQPPLDGFPPDWRANVVLWMTDGSDRPREASPLTAEIELRRASLGEVRARLVDVVSRDIRER